jgi:iron complex outermembrane receptor protein
MTLRTLLLGSAAAGLMLSLAPAPLRAQETGQGRLAIEEIVVTARKVEERLQDVPLSVSAFSSEQLARRAVQQLEDVARYTPGFAFEDFVTGFNGAPSIRGLSQVNVQGAVQNVASFLDGVYLQRGYSLDVGALDLARFEVVKGPQSALYGQNAFAGALNYVLAKPGDELDGVVRTTVGTDGRIDVSAAAGGPVIPGKAGLRVAYARNEFDGTWKNNYPGIKGAYEKLGGSKTENWSVTGTLTPVENLNVEVTYLQARRKQEPQGAYSVAANDPQFRLNCGPTVNAAFVNAAGQSVTVPNSPRYICGEIPFDPLTFRTAASTRLPGIVEPKTSGTISNVDFFRAKLSYNFLEDFTANYLFGWVKAEAADSSVTGGNKFTPTTLAPPLGRTVQAQRQGGTNLLRSHEARLDWEPADFPLTVRVGYYHADVKDRALFANRRLAPGLPWIDSGREDSVINPAGFTSILTNQDLVDKTDAIFGQISYSLLNDRLTLTAEARRQWDERAAITRTSNPVTLQSGKFRSLTPRFTGEFKLTDENLLYASAAKGVKAGGFNPTTVGQGIGLPPLALLPNERTFEDESNWTYEIGSKNTFFDGRLLLNASVFYIDWTQMQVRSIPSNFNAAANTQAPPVIFLNLGNARSKGVEIESAFAVTDELSLNLSAALQDPKYKKGTKSRRFAGTANCDNVLCPVDGEIGGKRLDRAYTFAFTAGANWEASLTDSIDYYIRADVTYQNKQYAEEMNLAWLPSRTLVNASIGLVGGEMWEVQLWGKNLFDKKYVANSLFIIQFGSYSPSYGERLTAGATFTLKY